ncbi:hypothetical protein H8S33_06830 [Ornithinibacillus sp. BX22]|uniref:YhfM-like domain-containing protein n=1 Tax=Ornithinibacillus hominis TaxID=2763055 RepID=A0A923L4Z3_9BACI|nr:hypothetical protein [Ornithinibacillus hominis]MBC5636536.1 hypothetical protein [Ornithinibacillus hominis]
MKKIILLLGFPVLSSILSGCQTENNSANQAEIINTVIQHKDVSPLILNSDIATISFSKAKNASPIVLEEAEKLEKLKQIISGAKKEKAIVNMANPNYYIEVIDTSNNKQHFHLWIGKEGQQSSLMNTDDTHTIYTVSEEMMDTVMELINVKWKKRSY